MSDAVIDSVAEALAEAPRAGNGQREAERYLRARGWVKAPEADRPGPELCWADPLARTAAATPVKIGERKLATGKVEDVKQMLCPPGAWYYTTAQAVELQRLRDAGDRHPPAIVTK